MQLTIRYIDTQEWESIPLTVVGDISDGRPYTLIEKLEKYQEPELWCEIINQLVETATYKHQIASLPFGDVVYFLEMD